MSHTWLASRGCLKYELPFALLKSHYCRQDFVKRRGNSQDGKAICVPIKCCSILWCCRLMWIDLPISFSTVDSIWLDFVGPGFLILSVNSDLIRFHLFSIDWCFSLSSMLLQKWLTSPNRIRTPTWRPYVWARRYGNCGTSAPTAGTSDATGSTTNIFGFVTSPVTSRSGPAPSSTSTSWI